MDKVLELLEKHCQWLAVGLGGLFLGWMAWSYGLMTPVSTPNGSAVVTPSDVDETVSRIHAEPIKTEIDNANVPAVPPNADLTLQSGDVGTVAPPSLTGLPALAFESHPANVVKVKDKEDNGQLVRVTELPAVLPAMVVEAVAKRATIDPAVQVIPGRPATPAPAPAPGVPAGPSLRDINYVRISYSIDPAEIAKSFDAVKVPANLTTAVISTQLLRQEQLPDGTWAGATVVVAAKSSAPVAPVPPMGAGPEQFTQFRQWAESEEGRTAVLRPVFYTVQFGEGPWDPSMDDALPKFDPAAALREKQQKAKEEQEKRKAATPRPSAPPRPSRGSGRRGGGGGGGAGGEMPAAVDPQRPTDLSAIVGAHPTQAPMQPPAGDTPANVSPTPSAPVAPGSGQPPTDRPLPGSPFFVPNQVQTFLGWAYDDSVIEGHTYRYQVVYSLRNPIYDTNLANPPELAQVFELKGVMTESAWGQPVEVKPSAEYYLAANNWQSGTNIPKDVKIDVYKWALGKWQKDSFPVAPGDRVGAVKGAIDYSTNTTLVDLRYDDRGVSSTSGNRGRSYVLLLTADGRLVEREPTADRNNPRMNSLNLAIEQFKNGGQPVPGMAPPPPSPGAPPGAPPQIGPNGVGQPS